MWKEGGVRVGEEDKEDDEEESEADGDASWAPPPAQKASANRA